MSEDPGRALRERLVAELEAREAIRSPAVREAFLAVPRERFVPEVAEREGLEAVYADRALVTKWGPGGRVYSSSSQPALMADMLERLELRPGLRVLEIGAGTGYNAALLAELVGPGGQVSTVDVDPEAVARSERALAAGGHRARAVIADGRGGLPAGAPYDRIVVTASAGTVARAWWEQLAPGGLLQVPLRLSDAVSAQAIPVLRREDGHLRSQSLLAGSFLPLRDGEENGTAMPGPPGLYAGERRGAQSTVLVELEGSGIEPLAPAGRAALLALVLGKPRRCRLDRPVPSLAPSLFVTLGAPQDRVLGLRRSGELFLAPGLATPSWDGVAALHEAREEAAVLAWGNPAAEDALVALLAEWEELGRPSLERLELVVAFDEPTRGAAWRTRPAGEAQLAFSWRAGA